MTFRVVIVSLAVFFIGRLFVRAVAEGLIFRKAAHANPDRSLLRFDLERLLVVFYYASHEQRLMHEWHPRKSFFRKNVADGRKLFRFIEASGRNVDFVRPALDFVSQRRAARVAECSQSAGLRPMRFRLGAFEAKC